MKVGDGTWESHGGCGFRSAPWQKTGEGRKRKAERERERERGGMDRYISRECERGRD